MVPMPMIFDELAVFHKNLYIELCMQKRSQSTNAWYQCMDSGGRAAKFNVRQSLISCEHAARFVIDML